MAVKRGQKEGPLLKNVKVLAIPVNSKVSCNVVRLSLASENMTSLSKNFLTAYF